MRSASLLHLLDQVLIAADVRAAGRADLHEGELVPGTPGTFPETLDSAEALRNALGVVDAVHADAHEGGAHAESASSAARSRCAAAPRRLAGPGPLESGDADRERANQGQVARRGSPRSARVRCAIPARGPPSPGSYCSAPECGSRSGRRPAARPATRAATGRCRRPPDWATECARRSPRARPAAAP